MKKIIVLLAICLHVMASDIVVFENEYKVLDLHKQIKKIVVGNQDVMNVSVLGEPTTTKAHLKLFGKTSGNTSMLVLYTDNSIEDYHIYVNQNLGYIQKMINVIEPKLSLSKVGNGATVISGTFNDPHQKNKIYDLLASAGINMKTLMDLTKTTEVNKMIRTKLYLVQVDNNRAKDLGGVTGLSYFSQYFNASLNAGAKTSATFSGFLLDETQKLTAQRGNSVTGMLKFLESKGIAKILDDTVLTTTEDNNASFHVGGQVYIPIGLTQSTTNGFPTIQLEEKEYGLRLTLRTKFMEKKDFMHIDVQIKDSDFDTNELHQVKLGPDTSVPAFFSKNISTDIVAKSKQVIALGGRLHTQKIQSEDKIPFLGDIPYLGALFRNTTNSTVQNDLIFFLVPEIVDANDDINDTKFYKDFKNEGMRFHKDALDENVSKENNASKEYNLSQNSNSTQMIETNTTKQKEYIFEIDDTKSNATVNTDISKEPHKKEVADTQSVKEKTVAKDLKKYRVATQNIFLRTSPSDGEKKVIWAEGHTFSAKDEENHNGLVWLKVEQDCSKECILLSSPLWISKKYTKEL